MADRPAKRQRLEGDGPDASDLRSKRSAFLSSLTRDISPPGSRRGSPAARTESVIPPTRGLESGSQKLATKQRSGSSSTAQVFPSPFKLTRVTGLPSKDNIDTISLHDIMGDPLIKQAWIFNFCFDVDYVMRHFDADVRQLVDVRVVHGSWRTEDGNRIGIEQAVKTWKNVRDIKAYLPDAFGTHHSKMMVLFKHDDTAQVIIHTANMLEKDWEHMTNAVWQSPILHKAAEDQPSDDNPTIGTGQRFKADILRYIKAYGPRLKSLAEQLAAYDFSAVRAALVASVPSRVRAGGPSEQKWGHLALREVLQDVNTTNQRSSKRHLVSQISSIASLPAKWLDETLYRAVGGSIKSTTHSIIYPTQKDLQQSLTGYATGGSIHTKIESAIQQKQVTTLRPQLHRWAGQSSNTPCQAGRHLVPPHIKTYICYSDRPTVAHPAPNIDWVLVSSANLSKQAWGTAGTLPKGTKDAEEAVSHISSFEIGVLVWPELFGPNVSMVPVFGTDTPEARDEPVIGMRMPYDLPLTPYGPQEMPWSPSASYTEPDRLGQKWM